MAKYSKAASKKVEKLMHEKKRGTLKSGSGRKVTSRKQAIVIALSEARKEGAKVPSKKGSSKKALSKTSTAKKGASKKSSTKKTSSKKAASKKSTSKKQRQKKVLHAESVRVDKLTG